MLPEKSLMKLAENLNYDYRNNIYYRQPSFVLEMCTYTTQDRIV